MSSSLDTAVQALVHAVVSQVQTSAPSAASSPWYDQDTSPLPRRRYLELARAGAFPAHNVGKRVLSLRADVDAWIARQPKRRRAPANDDGDLPVEALLGPGYAVPTR